jgi:hypothetical protein
MFLKSFHVGAPRCGQRIRGFHDRKNGGKGGCQHENQEHRRSTVDKTEGALGPTHRVHHEKYRQGYNPYRPSFPGAFQQVKLLELTPYGGAVRLDERSENTVIEKFSRSS